MTKSLLLLVLASVGLSVLAGAALAADIPEACNSYKPAVTGGPMPSPESDAVVIRWLGNANFEFAYKGKVYLVRRLFRPHAADPSAWLHRGGCFESRSDLRVACAFRSYFGHWPGRQTDRRARRRHANHGGDRKEARRAGKQIVVAKGGETLKFGDATAEIALAQHSTIQPGLIDIYASLYQNDSPPYSEDEKKELARVRSLGTFDPKVITEGTLAYGLVFPSGFKAVLIGSAGPITAGVRALAEKLGPVDVAIVAYQVHAVADTQIGYTWPFIELFKPKLFLPAHHDAAPPTWVDLGIEPLFDRIRANMPNTAFLAPLYRSPICVAGAGSDKGKVVSFKP